MRQSWHPAGAQPAWGFTFTEPVCTGQGSGPPLLRRYSAWWKRCRRRRGCLWPGVTWAGDCFGTKKEAYTLDLPKEAAAIREAFERTVPAAGREQMEIRTQLGRFLAAPCGLLLATVRGVKDSWVGVDASMADLPRACLAGVQYHVPCWAASVCRGGAAVFCPAGAPTAWIISAAAFSRRFPPAIFWSSTALEPIAAHGQQLRRPSAVRKFSWRTAVPRLIRRREVVEDLLPRPSLK